MVVALVAGDWDLLRQACRRLLVTRRGGLDQGISAIGGLGRMRPYCMVVRCRDQTVACWHVYLLFALLPWICRCCKSFLGQSGAKATWLHRPVLFLVVMRLVLLVLVAFAAATDDLRMLDGVLMNTSTVGRNEFFFGTGGTLLLMSDAKHAS